MNTFNRLNENDPFYFVTEAIETDEAHHWLPASINFTNDEPKWKNMSNSDKNTILKVFRYFTQGDVQVANAYLQIYIPLISQIKDPTIPVNEITNMLVRFTNMEVTHQRVYDLLLKAFGIHPLDFLQFKELREKNAYFNEKLDVKDLNKIGESMMIFGGFLEGVLLYSAFAIIKTIAEKCDSTEMKAIVEYSMRDEDLHSTSLGKLFHALGDKQLFNKRHAYLLQKQSVKECIELEFEFLDELAKDKQDTIDFEDLKHYVLDLSNIRLKILNTPYTSEELFEYTKYSYLVDEREAGMRTKSKFIKEFEIATSNTQKSNLLEGNSTLYAHMKPMKIDYDDL
jgi:ribonucleoside-diphosphate reductase beta chain